MKRLIAAFALIALPLMLATTPTLASRPHRGGIGHSWDGVATVAPGGGYVIGNPKAKVRLIEYASLTCPHCAAFAATGWPGLVPYIRAGTLALEVRAATRDRYDVVATILARCQGPQRYIDTAELLFAHQAEWLNHAVAWEGNAPDLSKMAPADMMMTLAQGAGLDTLLAQRGMTPATIKACLADKTAQDTVTAMTSEAWQQRHIGGTPAFVINDVAIDVHDWNSLQPFVADAVK